MFNQRLLAQGWRHEVFFCFVVESRSYYREGNTERRGDGWGEGEKRTGYGGRWERKKHANLEGEHLFLSQTDGEKALSR